MLFDGTLLLYSGYLSDNLVGSVKGSDFEKFKKVVPLGVVPEIDVEDLTVYFRSVLIGMLPGVNISRNQESAGMCSHYGKSETTAYKVKQHVTGTGSTLFLLKIIFPTEKNLLET